MSELDSQSHKSRLSYALALLSLQVVISLVLCFLMYIAPLSTAACDESCDYATLRVAVNSFFVIALVAFVGSLASLLLLRNRGWWAITPPITSIVLVTAAWFITTDVANRAMLLY